MNCRLSLLTDKYFILGLFCLLMNDLLLKYTFGGFITGKLSDMAGLFIFPFFWSSFFARHKLKIYLLTALIFLFWKIPLSTSLIHWMNHALGTGFGRVVDYTDLAALLILPFSYLYFTSRLATSHNIGNSSAISILIVVITFFAFAATTLPTKEISVNMKVGASYKIELNKEEIFTNRIAPARELSGDLKTNLSDSLFFLEFSIDNRRLLTEVRIQEIDERNTGFQFVSVVTCTTTGGLFTGVNKRELEKIKKLKVDDYKDLFKRGVIDRISNKGIPESPSYIYYWNPKLDPTILTRTKGLRPNE